MLTELSVVHTRPQWLRIRLDLHGFSGLIIWSMFNFIFHYPLEWINGVDQSASTKAYWTKRSFVDSLNSCFPSHAHPIKYSIFLLEMYTSSKFRGFRIKCFCRCYSGDVSNWAFVKREAKMLKPRYAEKGERAESKRNMTINCAPSRKPRAISETLSSCVISCNDIN